MEGRHGTFTVWMDNTQLALLTWLSIQVSVWQNMALHLRHVDLKALRKLSDKSFLGDCHFGILQLVNGAALSPWMEERAV